METLQTTMSTGALSKKKTKYTPISSLKDFLVPGIRMECYCEAQNHALVANCLNCGRVVCQQEGSGPCFTCGKLVCTKEEKAVINSRTKEGNQLYCKLMAEIAAKGATGSGLTKEEPTDNTDDVAEELSGELKRALELKEKLIDFDKNSAQRTHVIDDESDFYNIASTKWMSQQQRNYLMQKAEELHNQRHGSRLDRKYVLDLGSGNVMEASHQMAPTPETDAILKEAIFGSAEFADETNTVVDISLHDPSLPQPQYQSEETEGNKEDSTGAAKKLHLSYAPIRDESWDRKIRIQDKEFLEMTDEGVCLTIQQPWASLLMAGIKLHEGRSWYTPHRGRLWIHSGNKFVSPEDISRAQEQMKSFFPQKKLEFPTRYPTGCLLGCVLLQDCLPQEEYTSQFHNCYCGDPYVFICEEPCHLKVKIPMKGINKIYKLEAAIHKTAQKSLILQ